MCACVLADGSETGVGGADESNESGSSSEAESQGTELFWLDYQSDSGSVTSFIVHKVCTLACVTGTLL